ncbi:MAG: hypothetical protein IH587_01840 [Anaerolineae bacterium]|nr:hypothetical protein [Anaerolineae bacterium]
MSEYQYYEFQALDRRLTEAEMAQVSKLSSRVRPTPTQAVFVYNWGDFRDDPLDVLARYYDAMLYMANWGTRQLAFRLPKQVVRIDELRQYEYADFVEIHELAEHIILDLKSGEEGGGSGWLEGEGIRNWSHCGMISFGATTARCIGCISRSLRQKRPGLKKKMMKSQMRNMTEGWMKN